MVVHGYLNDPSHALVSKLNRCLKKGFGSPVKPKSNHESRAEDAAVDAANVVPLLGPMGGGGFFLFSFLGGCGIKKVCRRYRGVLGQI